MAQVVGYYQDNVVFTEGPFVIVNANGWRIEVELKGHRCPVLPASSIYQIMEREQRGLDRREIFTGKTDHKEKAERICDRLNAMVRSGQIVLQGNWWVDARLVAQAKANAEKILQDVW